MGKEVYVWSDEEFYRLLKRKSEELRRKGVRTSVPDLTRRLTPLIQKNVDFDSLCPKKLKWKRRIPKEPMF